MSSRPQTAQHARRGERVTRAVGLFIVGILSVVMGWMWLADTESEFAIVGLMLGAGFWPLILIVLGGRFLQAWTRITVACLLVPLNMVIIRIAIDDVDMVVFLAQALLGTILVMLIIVPVANLLTPEEPRLQRPTLARAGALLGFVLALIASSVLAAWDAEDFDSLMQNPFTPLAAVAGILALSTFPTPYGQLEAAPSDRRN